MCLTTDARSRAAALLVLTGLLCPGGAATAQHPGKYPDRPVRIMLPFGPGGIADVTMRLVAGKLSERMGQQFVIENKPGAGAINAAMAAKSSAPDGYTLLLAGNGSALSVSLFKSLPHDIVKDFSTISVLAQFDMLLAAKGDGEIGSVGKLIERARANPGKLNFGTVAAGSTQNLAAEMFKAVTGVEAAVVTFRTSPDLVTALLRGDVDVGFDYLAAFSAGLSDKKLKIIASGGEKRSPLTPDAPTVVEGGWPEYVVTSWNGVSAPAGTPAEIINKLNREINEVLKLPEVQARSTQLGMEAVGSTPEGMAKRMQDDIVRWRGVITKLGLQR
jgi:tripartite-type tricarboxylate transporter receptor subunit TctC